MKRGNTALVLVLLVFAVGCGQSKQVKVTQKPDPPGGILYEQNGDLCVIPVMHAGFFVQVEGCNERRIKLAHVECGDIGKGSVDFPCYHDCERIKIRANFEAKLGLKRKNIGNAIKDWKVYFHGSHVVDAGGEWNEMVVCVDVWKAKLYKNAPGAQAKVGEVTITVRPDV